jgi:F0F1-type ATP synthase gamma subunit
VANPIGATLLLMPQPAPESRATQRRGALIPCAAENGFVGGFNERLVEAAEAALEGCRLLATAQS